MLESLQKLQQKRNPVPEIYKMLSYRRETELQGAL